MKSVFLLWHTNPLPDQDDEKLLGVFSSNELALDAKKKSEGLEGFRDHLDGFEIVEYDLDKRKWTEGFFTEKWFEIDEKNEEFEYLKITKFELRYLDGASATDFADVFIEFENDYSVSFSVWRVFGKDLRISKFDHNQKYGLPKPINAFEELCKYVKVGMLVDSLNINRHTGDLNIELETGITIQCLNLTGHEEWELNTPEGMMLSNYHKFE